MATRPQYWDKVTLRPSKTENENTVELTDEIAQAYWSDGSSVKFFGGIPMIVEKREDGTFYEVYNDDGTPNIEASEEVKAQQEAARLASEAKINKVEALNTLVVEINGVTYDAHQEAINNMSAVTNVAHTKYNQLITSGVDAGMAYESVYKQVVPWKGADNEVHSVQVESLVEALEAAMTERAKIYQAM